MIARALRRAANAGLRRTKVHVVSKWRVVLALGFALIAVGALGSPAAAATVISGCSGTCGYWQVDDMSVGKKGADCVYQNSGSYNLKQITVRAPLMHGNYSSKTKVGWRFNIQRKNVNGGSWTTQYTSSYQTAKADDSIPAYTGHGFARRTYNGPSHPQGYYWRVTLDLQWWGQNNGLVEGTLTLKYDWYKAIRGGDTNTNANYCLQSY
jgi:hypothetical protein